MKLSNTVVSVVFVSKYFLQNSTNVINIKEYSMWNSLH
jgi:hypothetical protein